MNNNDILDLIERLIDYMEERSDADYSHGAFQPNEEMQLLTELEELESKLTTKQESVKCGICIQNEINAERGVFGFNGQCTCFTVPTTHPKQPQQTVSKEIQFIKHTLKAIIRWHRDERNPKNFPISSTLDALNYLDKLQANQTNEVTECECGHTVPLDYAVTDGEHWTCMPCHIEWLEEKAQTNEGEFTLEDVVENLENNINELKKLISC